MSKAQYAVVLVTAPDQETARKISRAVVEQRAAACANLLPAVESIYRWEGAVQADQEVLILFKTRLSLVDDQLIPLIKENHPYQVPEIIALPITEGSGDYLDWIRESTEKPG
jgi:periplasmic divalent cation tolerance protein